MKWRRRIAKCYLICTTTITAHVLSMRKSILRRGVENFLINRGSFTNQEIRDTISFASPMDSYTLPWPKREHAPTGNEGLGHSRSFQSVNSDLLPLKSKTYQMLPFRRVRDHVP